MKNLTDSEITFVAKQNQKHQERKQEQARLAAEQQEPARASRHNKQDESRASMTRKGRSSGAWGPSRAEQDKEKTDGKFEAEVEAPTPNVVARAPRLAVRERDEDALMRRRAELEARILLDQQDQVEPEPAVVTASFVDKPREEAAPPIIKVIVEEPVIPSREVVAAEPQVYQPQPPSMVDSIAIRDEPAAPEVEIGDLAHSAGVAEPELPAPVDDTEWLQYDFEDTESMDMPPIEVASDSHEFALPIDNEVPETAAPPAEATINLDAAAEANFYERSDSDADSEPITEAVAVMPRQVQAKLAVFREVAEPEEVVEADRLTIEVEQAIEQLEEALVEYVELDEPAEVMIFEAEDEVRQVFEELLETIGVAEQERQELIEELIQAVRIQAAVRREQVKVASVEAQGAAGFEKQFIEDYEVLKHGVKTTFSKAVHRMTQLLGSFTVHSAQFQP